MLINIQSKILLQMFSEFVLYSKLIFKLTMEADIT